MMNRTLSRSLSVGIVVLVLADWLSKFWIVNRMALGAQHSLVDGWLYFVHRKNPGVAFSMLADLPDDFRVPLLAGASLLGVALFTRIILTNEDAIVRAAASLVIAGAIGNLGDRVVNGHVTDFVLVRFFPFVFNLADAAITIGGILLAIRLTLADEAPAEAPATTAPMPDQT